MSDRDYFYRLIEGSIASLITIFIFDRGRSVRRQLRRLPPVGFANDRATATQDWEPSFRRYESGDRSQAAKLANLTLVLRSDFLYNQIFKKHLIILSRKNGFSNSNSAKFLS
jgi:hypothetical protein